VEKQKLKGKNRYAQKYRYSPGIRGVSPEEEKESYGGNDSQKKEDLSME